MRIRYYIILTEHGRLNAKSNICINPVTSTNIIIKKNKLIKLGVKKILTNFQIY